MEAICKAVDFNVALIEKLSKSFEVEITDDRFEMALEYCRRNGSLQSLTMILVREIYETFVERHSADTDRSKFLCHPGGNEPWIKYDDVEIKSEMHIASIIKEQKEREQDEEQRTAPRDFHLTEADKKLLLDHGCNPEDLDWIELEANVCRYFLNKPNGNLERVIERDEAIRLLGRSSWLYGLDRTAFHWSTEREVLRGKRTVSFESGLMGRYHNKYVY